MAKVHQQITGALQAFIARQHIFFVATAPLDPAGHVNLSPKGVDCFRVLSPTQVAYMDLIGSGNETSAHIQENGRLTFMFCAFDGPPNILRLYGTGRTVLPGQPEWSELAAHFTIYPNTRQIIAAEIERVQTSCGFGMPIYEYSGERDQLFQWADTNSADELAAYQRKNNLTSIDGLPAPLQEVEMDPRRKQWNEQQKELRQALEHQNPEAVALFLSQHAMLHGDDPASFDDELWQDFSDDIARRIPRNEEHSIVWCLWHLARIEDVTMNLLLAGTDQLFERDGWAARLKVDLRDTGNAMPPEAIAALSAAVDLAALRAYRLAVGRRTREIVRQLQPADFKRSVDASRLQRVLDEGAVCEASRGLLDYWGGLTCAGLLLMPPTRHNLVHLNEAIHLKQKSK